MHSLQFSFVPVAINTLEMICPRPRVQPQFATNDPVALNPAPHIRYPASSVRRSADARLMFASTHASGHSIFIVSLRLTLDPALLHFQTLRDVGELGVGLLEQGWWNLRAYS